MSQSSETPPLRITRVIMRDCSGSVASGEQIGLRVGEGGVREQGRGVGDAGVGQLQVGPVQVEAEKPPLVAEGDDADGACAAERVDHEVGGVRGAGAGGGVGEPAAILPAREQGGGDGACAGVVGARVVGEARDRRRSASGPGGASRGVGARGGVCVRRVMGRAPSSGRRGRLKPARPVRRDGSSMGPSPTGVAMMSAQSQRGPAGREPARRHGSTSNSGNVAKWASG